MDPSHAHDENPLPDVASIIEDALRPHLSKVKDYGVSHGVWQLYEIQLAVKHEKDLRIIQVWASVNWPLIRPAVYPADERYTVINMANPDSYSILKTEIEETIKKKMNANLR